MLLKFMKMQGAGNDFVVIDATREPVRMDAATARRIADRHFGIGCDQILIVEPPASAAVDFGYRIFNADGNEVEQCGNGARCFARFVRAQGLTDKDCIRVQTQGGIIEPCLVGDGQVRVDMGSPGFAPADLPMQGVVAAPSYRVDTAVGAQELRIASMGNPHAVLRVDDVLATDVAGIGTAVAAATVFPQGVNVGFLQVDGAQRARLRVFERGAGETLACGTGACAAVAVGIRAGWLQSPVTVVVNGGELHIAWEGGETPVLMTGPAEFVFAGSIEL